MKLIPPSDSFLADISSTHWQFKAHPDMWSTHADMRSTHADIERMFQNVRVLFSVTLTQTTFYETVVSLIRLWDGMIGSSCSCMHSSKAPASTIFVVSFPCVYWPSYYVIVLYYIQKHFVVHLGFSVCLHQTVLFLPWQRICQRYHVRFCSPSLSDSLWDLPLYDGNNCAKMHQTVTGWVFTPKL